MRYLALILLEVFAISFILISGCASISEGPHSKSEVLSSFANITEQCTLAARQNIYSWWSERLNQGSVKYIKAQDYYEIEFVSMSGVEEWGINMESSKIWPLNHEATISAFTLFCSSKDDPGADCQQWANQLSP